MIRFHSAGPIDEQALEEIERRLDLDLPPDHRAFLLSVEQSEGADLEESAIAAWRYGRIPSHLILIATDNEEGREYCMDVFDDNDSLGHVYSFEKGATVQTGEGLVKVANSLSELRS